MIHLRTRFGEEAISGSMYHLTSVGGGFLFRPLQRYLFPLCRLRLRCPILASKPCADDPIPRAGVSTTNAHNGIIEHVQPNTRIELSISNVARALVITVDIFLGKTSSDCRHVGPAVMNIQAGVASLTRSIL